MPRFVVLQHDLPSGAARASHWDLMFESEGALRTWALDDAPAFEQPIAADALADHRLHYLDYEGPIAGDRGVVLKWDEGEYTLVDDTRCVRWRARMMGTRLNGCVDVRFEPAVQRWLVTFTVD